MAAAKNGDTGRGIGASHQTGWTGLLAKLLQPRLKTDGTVELKRSVAGDVRTPLENRAADAEPNPFAFAPAPPVPRAKKPKTRSKSAK